MIAFRFKVAPGPAHHRVRVFVGKDFNHLVLSGELVMLPAEYVAFAQLAGGPFGPRDWDVHTGRTDSGNGRR